MDAMDTPEIHKHDPEAQYTDSLGKYLVVYACILLLAGLQFLMAYQHTTSTGLFARMFLVAMAESGLALLFFMHLWAEKRGFLISVVLITVFVLFAMQMSWSDSFRLLNGVPGAHPNSGVIKP